MKEKIEFNTEDLNEEINLYFNGRSLFQGKIIDLLTKMGKILVLPSQILQYLKNEGWEIKSFSKHLARITKKELNDFNEEKEIYLLISTDPKDPDYKDRMNNTIKALSIVEEIPENEIILKIIKL